MSFNELEQYQPENKRLLIVISGLSGSGKDSVVKGLKSRQLPFQFVVTATTRAMRPGEQEGVDYYFVSEAEFQHMIDTGELIEHARVYETFKGVPKRQVEAALESGKDVVMRLDVQGAAKIRSMYPDAILIFIIPGNQQEWFDRLKRRGTETDDVMQERIEKARWELDRLDYFDYVVVNGEGRLDETLDTISAIVRAEHHRIEWTKIRVDER